MSVIYFRPGNKTGRPSHYYHYLLGYLLPVFEHVGLDTEDTICLHSLPPMDVVTTSFGFEILQDQHKPKQTKRIPGHDYIDFWAEKPTERYTGINDNLNRHLRITEKDCKPREPYILLVDRGLPHEMLYDRRAPNRRCILNMAEVEGCVSKYGNVKRCVLDKVSLREQIILFRSASYIVAQHGGALTNLIFAKGCKGVLEIVDKTRHHPYFFPPISACFGIPHHQFFIDAVQRPRGLRWRVDIEQLDQSLKTMMT